MHNTVKCAVAGMAVAMFWSASAGAAVLVPVTDPPNSHATMVYGINDSNVIVGSTIRNGDGLERGFHGPFGGPYRRFDAGPGGTRALAISNDGHIVGYSNSQDGETDTQPVFERRRGRIVTVMNAGSPVYGAANGIANGNDAFVGAFWDWGDYAIAPFRGHRGQWSHEIRLPRFQFSAATGIDSAGRIVGYGATDRVHGFLLNGNRKSIALVDFPGKKTDATELHGMNDSGQASGQWFDINNTPHAFLLDLATNTFTEIKVPYATRVQAWGINSAGAVAVTSNKGSFIWCAVESSCPSPGGAIRVDAPVHRGAGKPIPMN